MRVSSHLATLLVCGLAAFSFTTILRLLPGVRTLVREGTKPFACNGCMSVWTSLLWSLALINEVSDLWSLAHWCAFVWGVAALAFWLLETHQWLTFKAGFHERHPTDYPPPPGL